MFAPRRSLLENCARRLFRTRQPSIVVMALPRSGSSWVGEILGMAGDAMYLREPLTQSIQAAGEQRSVFAIDTAAPPAIYQRAADQAFRGIPAFSDDIAVFPGQWRLRDRRRRRVVFKEVNPLASRWLVETYRPRVILVVRHPASVLISYHKLRWNERGPDEARACGQQMGEALRFTLDVLNSYSDHRIVAYEDVCRDPVSTFRQLYDFAELTWTSEIERAVLAHSESGNRDDVYGTFRDSKAMLTDWAGGLTREELEMLRDSYRSFGVPWYRDDQDWIWRSSRS